MNAALRRTGWAAPRRRVNTLCFMIDLWSARGKEPHSISQTLDRQKDLAYASRSDQNIETYRACDPGAVRKSARAETQPAGMKHGACQQDLDFSRTVIDERWQLGYSDAMRVLERAAWMDPLDPLVGVSVHPMPQLLDETSVA